MNVRVQSFYIRYADTPRMIDAHTRNTNTVGHVEVELECWHGLATVQRDAAITGTLSTLLTKDEREQLMRIASAVEARVAGA